MRRAKLLILCLAVTALLAGCASNAKMPLPTPSPTDMVGPTMMPADTTGPMTSPMPDTTNPGGMDMMSAEETKEAAKRISDEVVKLSEINKATTVIVGDTAIVGVNFDAQYRGQLTTRIKDMVQERAKKAVPGIQKVAVTADPDLMTRVQAIMTKIESGSSATDVGSEFTEILNRINPV